MTFLNVLAWLGVAILILLGVLFVALCIWLGHAAVQERALTRLEAEQAEAKLRQQDGPPAPHVPRPWRFDDEDLRDTGGV